MDPADKGLGQDITADIKFGDRVQVMVNLCSTGTCQAPSPHRLPPGRREGFKSILTTDTVYRTLPKFFLELKKALATLAIASIVCVLSSWLRCLSFSII